MGKLDEILVGRTPTQLLEIMKDMEAMLPADERRLLHLNIAVSQEVGRRTGNDNFHVTLGPTALGKKFEDVVQTIMSALEQVDADRIAWENKSEQEKLLHHLENAVVSIGTIYKLVELDIEELATESIEMVELKGDIASIIEQLQLTLIPTDTFES